MIITIHSIGQSAPTWITEGVSTLIARMPKHCQLQLKNHPTPKRQKNYNIESLKFKEAQMLLSHIKNSDILIACDEQGTSLTTTQFSTRLLQWSMQAPLHFCIGGPDGLHSDVLRVARATLALSPMTFTHALARLLLVEQIYRSACIQSNHPYHRA